MEGPKFTEFMKKVGDYGLRRFYSVVDKEEYVFEFEGQIYKPYIECYDDILYPDNYIFWEEEINDVDYMK